MTEPFYVSSGDVAAHQLIYGGPQWLTHAISDARWNGTPLDTIAGWYYWGRSPHTIVGPFRSLQAADSSRVERSTMRAKAEGSQS